MKFSRTTNLSRAIAQPTFGPELSGSILSRAGIPRLTAACLTAAALLAAQPAQVTAQDQVITRNTYRDVAQKVMPAVVNVKIKSNIVFGRARGKITIPPSFGLDEETRDYLEQLFERQMPNLTPGEEEEYKYARSGSGVVISPDGYIITSHHVVRDVDPADIEIALPDGRTFSGVKMVGQDELTDLAVIKVEGTNLPSVTWGDSELTEVGDIVMAIGNPLEFNNSVSEGIVSAKHRVIRKAPIEDLLQTTAVINPGNSGGALVNLDGELIGINMAIATNTGTWMGLGFAIPSKTARFVAESVISQGKVPRGYLGIDMSPLTGSIAQQMGYNKNYGIVVRDVRPGSAAEKGGLQRYDIIAKVNDREIKEMFDMHNNIGARKAGETVQLEVYRDEGQSSLTQKLLPITLGERPAPDQIVSAPNAAKAPVVTTPDPDVLGMRVSPSLDEKGVVVDSVKPGSRAAHAGLEVGDVILEMNKKKVKSAAELQEAMQARPSGEHLLYIERKGGTSAIVTISAE